MMAILSLSISVPSMSKITALIMHSPRIQCKLLSLIHILRRTFGSHRDHGEPGVEMKHGPIALIDPGFPVIAVATKSPTYDKVVSNLKECEARGATIIALATEGDEDIACLLYTSGWGRGWR